MVTTCLGVSDFKLQNQLRLEQRLCTNLTLTPLKLSSLFTHPCLRAGISMSRYLLVSKTYFFSLKVTNPHFFKFCIVHSAFDVGEHFTDKVELD